MPSLEALQLIQFEGFDVEGLVIEKERNYKVRQLKC